jgi:Fe-S oxidoreductase
MCGICSSRCPAGISHPQVAILARRLYGKYIAPSCEHLLERVKEINEGKHDESMSEIMNKSLEEQKALYNSRDIEK